MKCFEQSNNLKLSDTQKSNLRNWVSKNPNWTSIDDLPNDIFDDLVHKAGDNIDKRVSIQMKAIKFMKTLKKLRYKQDDFIIIEETLSTAINAIDDIIDSKPPMSLVIELRKARKILDIQKEKDQNGDFN